ncbi:hypothetical protein CLAFUW4_08003 [Fulvia fulva]|uniref:Uncharacterized protein n=1 Tax=Passalora fulva TaxID=5499 RepID=A0A9Q8P749_PASFU|nr:uncharacterized protein CLAFUR5_08125 [Fulvia fulva]KAK4629484.1 hypothetical protein CLAFUR4_08008 [Fulvia fulva]KAK4630290.1 hypothetical protein CLAFUR0_08004 [Fulvia fulva]UJO15527.1 hypothetical protein CLAFUR5_08125 [Fulvia fulva]WPV12457.1 hypothetical protein CLAFUW4_08003 [Fulvia fulva]WPV27602.1 hypothetical protein CLAFUW7_08003 [Fulvia fulva]
MAERMSALSCLRSRSTVALKRRPNSPIAIARLDVGAQMLSLIDLKSRTVCQRVVFGGCTCGKITDFVPANSIVSENSIMCKAGLPNQFKDSVSRTRNFSQEWMTVKIRPPPEAVQYLLAMVHIRGVAAQSVSNHLISTYQQRKSSYHNTTHQTNTKMYTSAIILSTLFASALAAPTEKRQAGITIDFIGGPASYSLTIPQDGSWVPTNSDLNISKLRSSANILQICQFQTNPPPAQAAAAVYVPSDDGAIDVGPPQPIVAVSCSGY